MSERVHFHLRKRVTETSGFRRWDREMQIHTGRESIKCHWTRDTETAIARQQTLEVVSVCNTWMLGIGRLHEQEDGTQRCHWKRRLTLKGGV